MPVTLSPGFQSLSGVLDVAVTLSCSWNCWAKLSGAELRLLLLKSGQRGRSTQLTKKEAVEVGVKNASVDLELIGTQKISKKWSFPEGQESLFWWIWEYSVQLKWLASKRGWWGGQPALSTLEAGREKRTFYCGMFDICLPSISLFTVYILFSVHLALWNHMA